MVLLQLHLQKFRNYQNEEITFHPGTNILYGKNGEGKTNILESIYYLALTKSFRTNSDQNLVHYGEDFFRIQGKFSTDQGRRQVSSIAFSVAEGKRLNFNGQKVQKFSDYIGMIPIVLLAPSDLEISQSGPVKRRQFLDIMISQASKLYLHHLMQYRRALKQRNQLLQSPEVENTILKAWDEALVQHGVVIIEKRLEAIRELDSLVKSFYTRMSGSEDKVKIVYQGSFPIKNPDNISDQYRSALDQNMSRDISLKTTGIGPHRDDLLFLVNGKPIRWVGSQGEHKTFIASLKMAEYHYLRHFQSHFPLLLFDDIFGELDAGRIGNVITSLAGMGQVFITTTSPDFFGKLKTWPGNTIFHEIVSGHVSTGEKA